MSLELHMHQASVQ